MSNQVPLIMSADQRQQQLQQIRHEVALGMYIQLAKVEFANCLPNIRKAQADYAEAMQMHIEHGTVKPTIPNLPLNPDMVFKAALVYTDAWLILTGQAPRPDEVQL